jgi:hypothetical protein
MDEYNLDGNVENISADGENPGMYVENKPEFRINSKLSPLMRIIVGVIGAVVTVFLILAQDFQLPIFGIFIIFFGFTKLHSKPFNFETLRLKSSPLKLLKVKYTGVGVLFGIITEILAILNNIAKPLEQRNLFHPDPVTDLILSITYYLPVSIAAMLVVFHYNIKLLDLFIAGGVYGILSEQDFAIFLTFNIFYWFYVFLVYGSFLALPFVIFRSKIQQYPRKQIKRILQISVFVVFVMCSFLTLAKLAMVGFWILLAL